jgi:hypothetical protein
MWWLTAIVAVLALAACSADQPRPMGAADARARADGWPKVLSWLTTLSN